METKTKTRTRAGDYGVIREINTVTGDYQYVVGIWAELGRDELVLISTMSPTGEETTFSHAPYARYVAKLFNEKFGGEDIVPIHEWERVDYAPGESGCDCGCK